MIEKELLKRVSEISVRPSFDCDTPLFRNKILDSMNLVELIRFIEESYHIKVFPSEIIQEHFESVHQMASFIRRKRG